MSASKKDPDRQYADLWAKFAAASLAGIRSRRGALGEGIDHELKTIDVAHAAHDAAMDADALLHEWRSRFEPEYFADKIVPQRGTQK